MAASQQHYDVVIVGAGVHGLCAARTFLTINSSLTLLIIDNKETIGGVWAKEQLYPGLHANNLQGYYEFTDFPMLEAGLEQFGVKERSRLSGEAVNAYVEAYAKHFDLVGRIRLKTRVVRAVHNEKEAAKVWTLELADVDGQVEKNVERVVTCSKLIVATGQASTPLLPELVGTKSFKKPIIHSDELAGAGRSLASDNSVAHVTIIGGSKSAHDAVYMFAMAGKSVTWLTRRTGRGVMPMAKCYSQMGPWSVSLEGLLMTRPLSWFGACPWSDGDGFGWIRGLLHGTTGGRWLVRNYFTAMLASSLDQSGILNDEKTKKLVPDDSLMWYGTQASTLTYDNDLYELIKDGDIEIVRDDIEHLDEGNLVLHDGRTIGTDALVCATGYQYGPSFPLEPASQQLRWGVPVSPSEDDTFRTLEAKADAELFKRFPNLAKSPASLERQPGLTPWRLWRFIAPPSEVCSGPRRSLAVFTAITSYQTTLKCELTSLWTYAYLFDELSVKPGSVEDIMYEATLWSRFGRWRCPMGMRGKIADFLHDSMPYYDLLMRDLGLRSWRKGWGLLGEVFGKWYEMKDYEGIVDEWIATKRHEHTQMKEKAV
ncbi:hypothetical protein MMC21_002838 [Puttea exsequens]|nr:hypothetical protein [Puttea exsequens]